MNIVYGSEISKKMKDKIKSEIESYSHFRKPHIVVIMVGNNPASASYVRGKEKACAEVGMLFTLWKLKENISEEELIDQINQFNYKDDVDGILIQLPLPKHLNERKVLETVLPSKDVDGLTTHNMGKLFLNEEGFYPCTPLGVIEILKEMNVDLCGKNVVIIGRSMLVGLPLARLLISKNATVTVCHSKTNNLKEICKNADVLIPAIGKAKYIDHKYIKEGAYVVDVGVNRLDGHLCGDVDFDDVKDMVSAITPVPKGVGPMTIAYLLENTMQAYRKNMGVK